MTSLVAVIVGCSRQARARVARMLAPYGFDCIAVRDKDAALEVASGGPVDLFVIDIDRPEADGLALDASLRQGELGMNPPPAILFANDAHGKPACRASDDASGQRMKSVRPVQPRSTASHRHIRRGRA